MHGKEKVWKEGEGGNGRFATPALWHLRSFASDILFLLSFALAALYAVVLSLGTFCGFRSSFPFKLSYKMLEQGVFPFELASCNFVALG